MVFVCEACGISYKFKTERGLRQHQLHCEEFIQADIEEGTIDDALGKYLRKRERKKQKAQAALSEVSLTGSGDASVATDENITGLQVEHEATLPKDTSQVELDPEIRDSESDSKDGGNLNLFNHDMATVRNL